ERGAGEGGGGLKKRVGESHTLTCTTSGLRFSNYGWGWIKKAPGKGLQWIAHRVASWLIADYYTEEIQGRFIIKTDGTSDQVSLTMGRLTADDTALYYCVRTTVIDNMRKGPQKQSLDFPTSFVCFRLTQRVTLATLDTNSKGAG
uniref:Immunoglobulin heavy variable 14-1 n=1 Tax=Hippocampus comes TaxID=109280 RepID=A0A3Q2XH33_HIPCM